MTEPQTNSERMQQLFDRWDSDFDSVCAAFKDAFAPDCLWENVGMPPTRGYDEAVEKILLPSHAQPLGMEGMRVETLSMYEIGNLVISERIDHIVRKDGSIPATIPIAGFVTYNDEGLITHWRDYCDPSPLHNLDPA